MSSTAVHLWACSDFWHYDVLRVPIGPMSYSFYWIRRPLWEQTRKTSKTLFWFFKILLKIVSEQVRECTVFNDIKWGKIPSWRNPPIYTSWNISDCWLHTGCSLAVECPNSLTLTELCDRILCSEHFLSSWAKIDISLIKKD